MHVDMRDLRQCTKLALDVIMAHRVAKGLSLSRVEITKARDTLEQRVCDALKEVDAECMPENWSWQRAAEELAIQAALEAVGVQRNEISIGDPTA